MKILFDTNVIIDAITNRVNADSFSQKLYLKNASKEIDGYLISKQITDIYYVLRKYLDQDARKEFISFLLRAFHIIPFDKTDIEKGMEIEGSDLEDNILIAAAIRNNLDYIVTNNLKHFKSKEIKILNPEEMIQEIDH